MPEFLQPFASVVALQLYWASITIIGWSLILWLNERFPKNSSLWKTAPLAAKFVIAAAAGFSIFGVFSVVAYALRFPAWTAVLVYLSGLLGASLYLYRNRSTTILRLGPSLVAAASRIKLFSPLGILMILLGVDLLFTFFIGSFMGGDGFVHVSKVRHILGSGFTLTDAYYGTVPETRHTISVLHTLLVVPSWFGIDPISSWYASGAFFKIVKSAAVFALAWQLFYWARASLRLHYSALVTIISLAIFSNYFISYPSLFVTVWIILLTIALLELAKNRSTGLLVMASGLIAVTHPVASMAAALLLGIVTVGFLMFDRGFLTKRLWMGLAASFVLLLSTPLFTATLPNQMTEATKNFAANDYSYTRLGGLQAFRPSPDYYFTTDSFTTMPWPIWVVSLLGVVGLFVFIHDRRMRIIMAAIVLYVPLMLYNPAVFSALLKVLPVWGIARFSVVNQLTLVLFVYGLLLICLVLRKILVGKHFTYKPSPRFWLGAVSLITVGVFVTMQAFGAIDPKADRTGSMYNQQRMVYDSLRNIKQALPDDPGAIILAEQTEDSFRIPVVASLRVVAIHQTNSPPAADMNRRQACFGKLYSTLQPGLLKQAGVQYVLVRKADVTLQVLAARQPELREVKQSETHTLYALEGAKVVATQDPICSFRE